MKFKVGDRVELVDNNGVFNEDYVRNGTKGVIESIDKDINRYCIKIDDYFIKSQYCKRQYTSYNSDLKLVTETIPESKAEPGFVFKMEDVVNRPSHYTQGKIEVIDFIEDQQLLFHESQVIKYVSRARYKGNELQDLKKAKFYLDRKIQKLENGKS